MISFTITILLSKIFKKLNKVKIAFLVFTLPNYFIGNQLQFIFTVLNDIMMPILSSKIWVIGFGLSLGFGVFTIVLFGYLQCSKKRGFYVDKIIKKNLGELFKNEKKSIGFTRITAIFDILMSLVLIIPSNLQRVQIGLWIIGEITLCILTIKMKPFKDKKFRHRTNIISVLFVILSISILILIQTKETHQSSLSLIVTFISAVILGIDMILGVYIMIVEIY